MIRRYADDDHDFIYADPPYFEKAGSLYLNAFQKADHENLAKCLIDVKRAQWILTYDDVPQVETLYAELRRRLFALNYSAHRVTKANEVMVFSDSMTIPDDFEAAHQDIVDQAQHATTGSN